MMAHIAPCKKAQGAGRGALKFAGGVTVLEMKGGPSARMLRRILLVVMAMVASYSLTGISGYMIYTLSQCRSEAQLSLLIRFIFNPLIALVVGLSLDS
jgi:uncharacterized membrane protein